MPRGTQPAASLDPAGADLDRLVRRLRSLTSRAWRTGERAAVVRALAEQLAAIGSPGRQLPEIPQHALADAIAVLGQDALDQPARTPEVRLLIEDALAATR
jgi:hypothetical protein